MDFTDIPLIILVVVFGLIGVSWFKGRSGKQTCKQCGKGTMQEMEAVPQGILHSSGDINNRGAGQGQVPVYSLQGVRRGDRIATVAVGVAETEYRS